MAPIWSPPAHDRPKRSASQPIPRHAEAERKAQHAEYRAEQAELKLKHMELLVDQLRQRVVIAERQVKEYVRQAEVRVKEDRERKEREDEMRMAAIRQVRGVIEELERLKVKVAEREGREAVERGEKSRSMSN
jgi:TolA-binding protein